MESNTGLFHPSFFVLWFSTRMLLTFSQPRTHGANRLHMAPPLRRCPPLPPGLSIGMLNVRDGQGFGLAQAIRAVDLRCFDVMILTKTKISITVYCWNLLGYKVTF